jgi:transposase-like protein
MMANDNHRSLVTNFPAIIRHAVWLYVRFTLSFRDVEDLLAERGLDVSYETVRRWVLKFGPLFARELRRRRSRPTSSIKRPVAGGFVVERVPGCIS